MLRCFADPTLILIFELSNEFLKVLILSYRSICRLHHHILVDHFIITHNTIHISIAIVGQLLFIVQCLGMFSVLLLLIIISVLPNLHWLLVQLV